MNYVKIKYNNDRKNEHYTKLAFVHNNCGVRGYLIAKAK